MNIWENMGPGRGSAVYSGPDASIYLWSNQVREDSGRDEERVDYGPAIFQGLVDYSKDWLLL